MSEQEKEMLIPQLVDEVRSGKLPRRQLMKKLTAMGISTVGVGAIVAATVVTPSSEASTARVNVTEDATKHLQMHDRHMSHQGQGDTGALQKDYADHAIVEDSMYPVPIVGRAAIIARKSLGFAAVSDPQISVVNRIAVGNQVTVEWLATGIHTGDLPGLPATGRSYTLRGVTVVVREAGKIVRESLYYDVDDLYRQLRQS
ncbi:MAG TPA: ester cyclase [Ktedonosporobacter sp.]|nr:ester cyclase [Ktedonosporobacter sp.]